MQVAKGECGDKTIVNAGAQAGRLDPDAAELEAEVSTTTAAVRHARDAIRRHVAEFVEKHHRPKSGKGRSTWN